MLPTKKSNQVAVGYTFKVSKTETNFLLSATNTAWLTIDILVITVCSISTGAMFSPPAVMSKS